MRNQIILLIVVLLVAGSVIGASRIPFPKPITFGNETTTTSEITTTSIEQITTTTTTFINTRTDWVPIEIRDSVIQSAGITDNLQGGINLRNGLNIKSLKIVGGNLIIDLSGNNYDLIRQIYTIISRDYQTSIDSTYTVITIIPATRMTDSQIKYVASAELILKMAYTNPVRYGERLYLPLPVIDQTLI